VTEARAAPPREGGSRRGERGTALAVVVLLTLAMLGLAHGLLVSAESAYTTSRVRARTLELEARADGLLRESQERGWAPPMDSVPLGGRWSETDTVPAAAPASVEWRRLGAEAWLVAAAASFPGGPPVVGRTLLWILDPETRIGALPGVVSMGAGAPIGVSGSVLPDTVPPLATIPSADVGRLTFAELLDAADSVGPSGTPGPVETGGLCEMGDPWNWGDPDRPYRPCGAELVLKGSPVSMVIAGGTGQGVFVVDGDLRIHSGGSLHGLVIASGRVDVEGGSTIQGRIVAFGGLGVEAGSVVAGSASEAEQALRGVRSRLGRAVPLHPARRLGPG
jgi:hypothetical protein